MHTTLKQSANFGAQVTAAPTTPTPTNPERYEWPKKWDCFEADLFELQLDASPSLDLRGRLADHLRDVLPYRRVMTASRGRLLQFMLQQDERLEQARHDEEVAA